MGLIAHVGHVPIARNGHVPIAHVCHVPMADSGVVAVICGKRWTCAILRMAREGRAGSLRLLVQVRPRRA
eukprot:5422616-Prymnesium_polylepis.1